MYKVRNFTEAHTRPYRNVKYRQYLRTNSEAFHNRSTDAYANFAGISILKIPTLCTLEIKWFFRRLLFPRINLKLNFSTDFDKCVLEHSGNVRSRLKYFVSYSSRICANVKKVHKFT